MSIACTAETQMDMALRLLLETSQGRARFAEYLARLEVNRFAGMAEFIDSSLERLAPQWPVEDRNARFEDLKDAIRSGSPARIEGAVHRLVEVSATCRQHTTEEITFSTRRPRQAIEATPGGEDT